MKVNKEITLSYIESLYKELEKPDNDLVDLVIPFEGPKEKNFSSLPAFIQFYATWIRSTKKGDLIFNVENLNIEDVSYDANIYSFITTCLNWESNIKDSKGSVIEKSLLRRLNAKINKKQRNVQVIKGAELLLACFDFDRTLENRGLLTPIYDVNGNLRDNDFFRYNLIPEILKSLGNKFSVSFIRESFKSEDFKNLGDIIYELFKNTHEWGRRRKDGLGVLVPNVRSIYCVIHTSTKKNFINYAQGNNGLQHYLSHNLHKPNSNNLIHFLEVSVFDSGIGFVKSFLKDEYKEDGIPIDQQVAIVKKCLTKYFTTDKGLQATRKGKGLDKVLQSLNGKGFLRIRTENVCLFRDLVKDDYSKINNENIDLFDWITESEVKFTKFSRAEGAALSLIYPINSGNYE